MTLQTQLNSTPSVILNWVGDISLDGLYCDPQHHEALSQNMARVSQEMGPCDIRIGNWESPLWGEGGMNLRKSPRLSTTLEAARCLLPLGLDVALLGNNHAYDCLEDGFDNTVRFLEQAGIRWLGAGRSQEEAARPVLLERNGLSVGVLNYVDRATNPNLPDQAGVFLNYMEEDRILQEVGQLARQAQVVIVHLHWGALELVSYPQPAQRSLARRIIEAGAKVVVGSHAHCLQGDEAWGKGHIYYGMGNFLFCRLPAGPGLTGCDWPRFCRDVGIVRCRVGTEGVEEASWKWYVQKDLLLQPDDSPSRNRQQSRRSAALAYCDRRLSGKLRRNRLWQQFALPALGFVRKSGGLIGTLFSIRLRHFAALWHALRARH